MEFSSPKLLSVSRSPPQRLPMGNFSIMFKQHEGVLCGGERFSVTLPKVQCYAEFRVRVLGLAQFPGIQKLVTNFHHSRPQSLRFFWSRGRRNGGLW